MGDTRRGVKRIIVTSANVTTKVLDKIQARDDIPPRARNVMGYVDKKIKQGAKEAERAIDRGTKKKTSHGHSHKHSSRPFNSSTKPNHHSKPSKGYPKPPKGYPKPPKGYPKPPKGYPKPPKGYPVAKPNQPGKYSAPTSSGLTLREKLVQKVMDPKVQAQVEKGEIFIRKQLAKKLNPKNR